MLAGTVMEHGGISRTLIGWIESIVGRIRGAMGAITVLTCMAFGVLTGSAMATISAVGKIIYPEMIKRGYRHDYSAALIASTCFLGILIPPSIPGIMYALCSGQSISDVWLSTVGPAFIIGLSYIVYNYFTGGHHDKITEKSTVGNYFKDIGVNTWKAVPALIMPLIIFGGIYGGIFTPTEAGAVCLAYGVIFYIIKKFRKRDDVSSTLWSIFLTGGIATAAICIINVFANTASRAISQSGISVGLANFIVANIKQPWIFLLISNFLFLVLGCLIDITSAVLMITPLLLPTAVAMGINPIHYGAIMLVNLSIGFITPPFAGGIFIACKVTGVDYGSLVKSCLPFLAMGFVVIALTTIFPQISLCIPALFK